MAQGAWDAVDASHGEYAMTLRERMDAVRRRMIQPTTADATMLICRFCAYTWIKGYEEVHRAECPLKEES